MNGVTKLILRVLSLTLLLLLSACDNGLDNTPPKTQLELLREMLDEVVTEYDAPGASMAIKLGDGTLFSLSTGFADRENEIPLETDQYFRVGSATKTFTAKAALLLYQDGLFQLDDSVESLLPDLEEFSSLHGSGITVRMLMNHTSGLADYVGVPYGDTYPFYMMIDDPLREWTPEALVEISVDYGLQSVPGEAFSYSNTNYILLGLIIEKLSGQNYAAFVKKRLIDPLGLEHTFVPESEAFSGDYAHGYFEKDSDGKLYDYSAQSPTAVWSAGNIVSTVPDLLIWLESLLGGELLSDEIRDEQFDFEVADGFGYGLGVASMGGALGHNGTVFGYQTQMFEFSGSYFVIYTNCYYQSKDNVSNVIFNRAKEIFYPE